MSERHGDRAQRVWSGARDAVVEHYERQLARHGATARGMEWKDAASQELRFAVLSEVCPLEGLSLHEVGAGAGHFFDFLQKQGVAARYSGSDLSPRMVDAARRLHPSLDFEVRDLMAGDPPERAYDVVACSGAFNVRMGGSDAEWLTFVQEAVRRMFRMCRVAIAFNLMSDQVDFRKDALFYAPAGPMLDFCRQELSRWTVLRHDYPLYEYTVYVYRDARHAAEPRRG